MARSARLDAHAALRRSHRGSDPKRKRAASAALYCVLLSMVRRWRRAVFTLRCREIISRIKPHPNDTPNSTTSTRAIIPDIGALPKGLRNPRRGNRLHAPGAQDRRPGTQHRRAAPPNRSTLRSATPSRPVINVDRKSKHLLGPCLLQGRVVVSWRISFCLTKPNQSITEKQSGSTARPKSGCAGVLSK